jgi:hypothetical protein
MGQFLEPFRIKGSFDLEDLQNRCGTIQNLVPCKLIRITKKTDEPTGNFNAGLFEAVDIGASTPVPTLIAVNDPTQIPSIMAEQMQAGRKMIFDSTIFVSNAEARVLGFR